MDSKKSSSTFTLPWRKFYELFSGKKRGRPHFFSKGKVVVSLPVPLFFKRHSWFFLVEYCTARRYLLQDGTIPNLRNLTRSLLMCSGWFEPTKPTWWFYFVHLSSTHHKGSQLLHLLLMYDVPLKGRLVSDNLTTCLSAKKTNTPGDSIRDLLIPT